MSAKSFTAAVAAAALVSGLGFAYAQNNADATKPMNPNVPADMSSPTPAVPATQTTPPAMPADTNGSTSTTTPAAGSTAPDSTSGMSPGAASASDPNMTTAPAERAPRADRN